MKEETKVRKAAEESGQCNMRTVTTEDNPYKVAGDILFASSEVELDLLSGEKKKMLYVQDFI